MVPSSWKATTEGVVRAPSLFSITLAADLPSIMATHELVVPKSIPITSPDLKRNHVSRDLYQAAELPDMAPGRGVIPKGTRETEVLHMQVVVEKLPPGIH